MIISGCGTPSIEEATAEFCQSLVAYSESLANLESISPASTVEELKDARKAEQRAREEVRDSAQDLREVKLDAIDQAWKDLDKTIDQISNQDTLAEAAGQVKEGLANVRLAYETLGLGNCPDLFPAAAEGVSALAPGQAITETQPLTTTQPITGAQPITGTQAITPTEVVTVPVTTAVTSTTTAATPAGPAPAGTSGLTGVTWQLQAIQLTSGSSLTPSDPALYTLTLQPDGAASVLADCFTGEGTYTVSGDSISFAIRYTGAMCPPPSIASQYTNYLDYATRYDMVDNTLVLTYSGTGKITFSQAPQ